MESGTPTHFDTAADMNLKLQSLYSDYSNKEGEAELKDKIKQMQRTIESKDRYIKNLKELNIVLTKKLDENNMIINNVTQSESKLKTKLISLLNAGIGGEKIDLKETAKDIQVSQYKQVVDQLWSIVKSFDSMFNFTKKVFDL